MTAYYNEIDPFAAEWLRNLIAAGHIAPGVVDERSIKEVEAFELAEFTQCHFFAGIGVWSLALRRAGWPDDRPIWTGSCPCQPFSAAGKQKGFEDERHLWPAWFDLVAQRRPPIIVGEQVASKDGLRWLDLVSTDLEGSNHAFGASDLCAAGFQEANLRQRIYFVALADSDSRQCDRIAIVAGNECDGQDTGWSEERGQSQSRSETIGLADDDDARLQGQYERRCGSDKRTARPDGVAGGLEHSDLPGQHERASGRQQPIRNEYRPGNLRIAVRHPRQAHVDGRWFDCDWLLCRNPAGEPEWRPVEPGTFPLAHGAASRMGKLRAYGNALNLETATQFCSAVREIVAGV